ncbi:MULTISPECIES: pyrroloquinoline quinone precursor peptide PqqA [Acidiphilium]
MLRREKRKTRLNHNVPGDTSMWTKPKLVEIAVGTEINCYACADLD